ncbi:MAG: D-alanine--D-alanine ligase family protein [Patescibacteria group bacterium]
MKKIKVAVLFGGKSAEHEVSLLSAKSVMGNINKEIFEIIPVKIAKNGKFSLPEIFSAEVIFPVLHGGGGEDGSIQGFCETLGKPYVGSGIEASAIALDKITSKQIWQNLKLPIPCFQFFNKSRWHKNPLQIMQKIEPVVFVKPANTGSSIGVTKVKKKSDLKKAIEKAFKYFYRVIIEEAIDNIREIEVAILGNNQDLLVSIPGEIIPAEEFYSYQAKYKLDSGLIIPAKLSNQKTKEIQKLAIKAFQSLGCRGMARIDFFLEKPEGKVYLNEINTIPGFTKISMYPKLMAASGISYQDLLTRLINLSIEK